MCPSNLAQGTSRPYELLDTKAEPDAIMRSNLWELLGESDYILNVGIMKIIFGQSTECGDFKAWLHII